MSTTVVALSWEDNMDPLGFSAVATAAHHFYSAKFAESKVVVLSSSPAVTVLTKVTCVSSLSELPPDSIDRLVLVGSISDCGEEVEQFVKRSLQENNDDDNDKKKVTLHLVETTSHEDTKEATETHLLRVFGEGGRELRKKLDTSLCVPAASRCSLLVSGLRELGLGSSLEETEIRYLLSKVFFDMCGKPNMIGLPDFEAGTFLRFHCKDLKAAFLPFDREEESNPNHSHFLSTSPPTSTSTSSAASSRSLTLSTELEIDRLELKTGKEVEEKIEKLHPPHVVKFLKDSGVLASELGFDVIYTAGGVVRDLFLGLPNQDIDLVVVGDGIRYADALNKKMGVGVTHHETFRTAVVKIKEPSPGWKVDVASCRQERYEAPAKLPTPEPSSSVWYDMERRDFTINAMALHLRPNSFGNLIDPFNGLSDLRKPGEEGSPGALRVIHPWSFVDDPTRIFRGIRLRHRMGLKFGALTKVVLQKAVQLGLVTRLSGSRLFRELQLILSEKTAMNSILELTEIKTFAISVHPSLSPSLVSMSKAEKALSLWQEISSARPQDTQQFEVWKVRFLSICTCLNEQEFLEVGARFLFSDPLVKELSTTRKLLETLTPYLESWSRGRSSRSELYQKLKAVPTTEGLVFFMGELEEQEDAIVCYLSDLRHQKLAINGNDLRTGLGLTPGPTFATLLHSVHMALLDGEVDNRKENQLAWLKARQQSK